MNLPIQIIRILSKYEGGWNPYAFGGGESMKPVGTDWKGKRV
jgi:hypothetical protein